METMNAFVIIAIAMASGHHSADHLVGKLSTRYHDVSGDVYAVDDRTLVIKQFVYDGSGPDSFFLVGRAGSPLDANQNNSMILGEVREDK